MRIRYRFIRLSIFILSIVLFISCNEKESKFFKTEKEELTKAQKDSLRKIEIAKEIAKYDVFPKIKYNKVFIAGPKELLNIFRRFKSDEDAKFDRMKILATLNRKEIRFFRKGDTIVYPDSVIDDIKAYACFPQYYPGAKSIKKIIMVSNRYQAYACYEFGKLVRFAASNTGKERTQTYPGRYALVWKELEHRSSLDSEWIMPYNFNFQPDAGNAFHQFLMPGRPVSHSCCRQFMDDAKWLFYWGEGIKKDSNKKCIPMSGTPVIIVDYFDFARARGGPWLDFKSNKDSVVNLPDKPMDVEEALIPICQIPEQSRPGLKNKDRFVHAEDTLRARGVIRKNVKLIVSVNFNQQRREKARKEARLKEARHREEARKKALEADKMKKSIESPDSR